MSTSARQSPPLVLYHVIRRGAGPSPRLERLRGFTSPASDEPDDAEHTVFYYWDEDNRLQNAPLSWFYTTPEQAKAVWLAKVKTDLDDFDRRRAMRAADLAVLDLPPETSP